MIWFDIKELERDLKNGDISDREIFKYVLATAVLSSVASYLGGTDSEMSWLLAAEIVVILLITVVGTKATFDINSSGDGKDYFRRFFSLSLVTGIRLFVFAVIAAFPIGAIAYFVDKNAATNDLISLMAFTALMIWYYFMLTNSFKRVSQ